jgi:pyruvate dehydrogenase E2 component (dihydrolipoamide acetyltransferase)
MAVQIRMPRLTDTMLEGLISAWLKQEGDFVQEGEPLFIVETDKASVEVHASATGVLLKILVQARESSAVEGVVAVIGEKGEDIPSLWSAPRPSTQGRMEPLSITKEGVPEKVKASPAAKRKAKEAKVDLKEVPGSGEDGLITEKDVAEYIKRKRIPGEPSSKYGPEEMVPLEGTRKVMAERMALSAGIPQVTTFAETDASSLVELSRETSITITSFIVRAVVEELKAYPFLNASLDGEKIILKRYYNIAVSVATPHGLMVPVLHNAEGKSIRHLAQELNDLANKAKENRLSLEDVAGGTFTVTNSGVFGSLFFTPRINPPQSAILGLGKIMKQPVVIGEEIAVRSMMNLCLSYDHRIIDGETAVKFLQAVKRTLESPKHLL